MQATFTFYTPDGAAVGTITCSADSQAYQQLVGAGYTSGHRNQVDTPGHFYEIESRSDNADQAHPLSPFAYVAIYEATFSTDKPTVLVRVPLVVGSFRSLKDATNEAHGHCYHINRHEGQAVEVAAVYHNRYGNARLPDSVRAELEKVQLHEKPIKDFGTVREMIDWLRGQDEAENGAMYDALDDAREWYVSNPENAHAEQVRRSQDRAMAEGRDFDPYYF